MYFTISKKLYETVSQSNQFNIKYFPEIFLPFVKNIKDMSFVSWGYRTKVKTTFLLELLETIETVYFEDGLIKSIQDLEQSDSVFSFIVTTNSPYYDAFNISSLENTISSFNDFPENLKVQSTVFRETISSHFINKYNNIKSIIDIDIEDDSVLLISQLKDDLSLIHGCQQEISTKEIFDHISKVHPNKKIYVKIHPKSLTTSATNDIDLEYAKRFATIISDDTNSIALLKKFKHVFTKTSSMGYEALIVGCNVTCFGNPFYSGWGLTNDIYPLERRVRKLSIEQLLFIVSMKFTTYVNPFEKKESDVFDCLANIIKFKNIASYSNKKIFCGISFWKRKFIKPFLFNKNIKFSKKKCDFSWGFKFPGNIVKIEDGFIRSKNLGSFLTKPYSLSIDSRGIYFDINTESDLEYFSNELSILLELSETNKSRIKSFKEKFISSKISKYNLSSINTTFFNSLITDSKRIIFIPGQVDSDMSIKKSGQGYDTLSLVKKVRDNNPDSFIVFKEHPDVSAGNRSKNYSLNIISSFVDSIIPQSVSIQDCISFSDEIHVITSTVGLEALFSNKKVVTYGTPFYAGYGFTSDTQSSSFYSRRNKISVDSFLSVVYFYYPLYIDNSNKLTTAEKVIDIILNDKSSSKFTFLKLYKKWRS
jgi:capsular polysaccharide export protein